MTLDFACIFASVYVAHLAGYFALGAFVVCLNRHHPHRRIQPGRRGEERARAEMVQSAKALLPISAMMATGLWAQRHGLTLFAPLELSWTSFLAMLAVSVILFDAWFYWAHRVMHWRPLYRFHRLHHRSVAPTVWSTYSDDLIDAVVHQSYLLIAPLLLPVPPAVLIAQRLYDHVNGQIGHAGFEYFAAGTARRPWPLVCTTFHDQHHELFRCNYGNFFSVWDRLMGTIHPAYDAKVAAMAEGEPSSPSRPAPEHRSDA